MDELESKNEKPKEGRRFDPELLKKGLRCDLDQYEMLKRCSDKKDMTEWNEWRQGNPGEDIWLANADFSGWYLGGAYLYHGNLYYAQTEKFREMRGEVHLEGANLTRAHLQHAELQEAHLEGAHLLFADLGKAKLVRARLQHAFCDWANLEGADLKGAHLEGASLDDANFKNADLRRAHLEGAVLRGVDFEDSYVWLAHLEGAHFSGAYLGGAWFVASVVDGATHFRRCKVNRRTDFRDVGLDNVRIDAATKQLLEYNGRRMNWQHWYWGVPIHVVFFRGGVENCLLRACRIISRLLVTYPVRVFWWMSDYGLRTWRIIVTFFGLAIAFAVAYWLWPSFVMVNEKVGDIRGFWHALYFSVVTMTTLGFGDIAANPDSWLGQTLLMVQVILGYVLLGALVTRFAVLFTAGGPAGKFANEKKNRNKTTEKIKN